MTTCQSLNLEFPQLLLVCVTTLMLLKLGIPFNYNAYNQVRCQLAWRRAQACTRLSALLVTPSLGLPFIIC